MTDKEVQKLKRSELLEIMLGLQNELDNKIDENKELRKKLEERQIAIDNAGSIAKAALDINEVVNAAQKAADIYLENVKRMHDEKEKTFNDLIEKATAEADKIVSAAKSEAEKIVSAAKSEADEALNKATVEYNVKVKETEEVCSRKIKEVEDDCARKISETNALCTRKINETKEKCTAISSLDSQIATFFQKDNGNAVQKDA